MCFDYSLCLNKMFRKQQLLFFSFHYPRIYRINTTDTTFFSLSPLLSISSSFYPLFFLSPLLSIFLPHSILRVTLTPFPLWPWKSAFRWPPYIDPLYYYRHSVQIEIRGGGLFWSNFQICMTEFSAWGFPYSINVFDI